MIHIFSSLILGIVEGFTEFLPISSTAHLILASRIMGIAQSNFAKTFEIAIQSGAILAVAILYFKDFLKWGILKKIIVAFIPTGIIGLILYKFIKTYLIGNTAVVLFSLAIGGAILILFEHLFKSKDAIDDVKNISYPKALVIGFFQSIAIIPGVSRAAATIVGGMFLGIKRETIVQFSFLLAVPTMLAATGLDLMKNFHAFSGAEFSELSIGFVSSFVMAIVGIRFLLNYIRKHSFTNFGIYRIVLVILFLIFLNI